MRYSRTLGRIDAIAENYLAQAPAVDALAELIAQRLAG